MTHSKLAALGLAGFLTYSFTLPSSAAVRGWLNWRGPNQNGTSEETALPDTLEESKALWTAEFPGQSTAVVAGGRVYIMGYRGDHADLQEALACFDAESGREIWTKPYNDFLSDTIYLRYSTSSAAVDGETGNVYMQGTQGILGAFTADGTEVWNHSLMERWGRLTFPNSRTASPAVDGDLVITRGITSNWGAQGSPGDRFYAFDKRTGELVWASSTGARPTDNSFSHPYFATHKGKRVFYAATGDGAVICVNARTGEPIWRVPIFKAGINATVLVHNDDKIISIFGTPYEGGQLVAFKIPDVAPTNVLSAPVQVDLSTVQLWANPEVSTSTSSPILVGDKVYVVREKGDLCSIDVHTGKVLWKLSLGIEQRNASPLFADGKLYAPILEDPKAKAEGTGDAGAKGGFYVVKPGEDQGTVLSHISLEGRCFGSPTAYNGKVYIQTTKKLYCFGRKGNNPGLPAAAAEKAWPAPGPGKTLQIIPSEVALGPGQTASFRARVLDANGFVVEEVSDMKSLKWASYVPPTALVKATMKGGFNAAGKLVADPDPTPSAGAFQASLGDLKGIIRGRVLPNLPIRQDFEAFKLLETTTNTVEQPTPFAYPPLPWIGARFRFEVRDREGNKALTKTIDNKLLQRGTVYLGTPEMHGYTVQADVLSDGTRRKMSEVGVVNQRYIIVLKGNSQEIEVNSNQERLKVSKPFKWVPSVWYRLKARVDVGADGKGVVRGKAWKRDEPEPGEWTIEVPHNTAHKQGAPGLFGFAPNEQRIYLDNISVTAN